MSNTDPFAIAKQALQMVGRFSTPPTPEVYEVWYRYVEGADQVVGDELQFAVNEANSVSAELLQSIYDQCFAKRDDSVMGFSGSLSDELKNIQSLVSEQRDAGASLSSSIGRAGDILSDELSSSDQVIACVSSLAAETARVQAKLDEVSEKLAASQEQVDRLQQDLATSQKGMMTDHLTGVGNRRYFDTQVRNALRDPAEVETATFLAIIDMDRFKQINDSFGHEAGDQIIRFVAKTLFDMWPDISLSRLGGDEFAVMLRCRNRDDAIDFCEQIRNHFSHQDFVLELNQQAIGKLSFSIGVAKLRPGDDPSSWFTRADSLLYQAKELGRDRAVVEK